MTLISPALLLVGCQSVAPFSQNQNSVNPTSLNQIPLDNAQSKTALLSALQHTLYHNQDWIATQQLHALSVNDMPTTVKPTWINLEKCQNDHDRAYVAQLKADHITKAEQVDRLTADKKQAYDSLKTAYLACATDAKASEQSHALEKENLTAQNDSTNMLQDTSGWLKLEPPQAELMNSMVTNSASIQYTGIYRPLQGRVAVQADAGFDNKNVHYHYRVPVVADLKTQALYIKPNIIMPFVSIYLDNQLGMNWQDKWYKFSDNPDNNVFNKLRGKAWLQAIKTGITSLPESQFNSLTPAQTHTLASQIATAVPQSSQSLDRLDSLDGLNRLNSHAQPLVIEWRQSASEQAALQRQIKLAFIENMDNALAKDRAFLALPADVQARQRERWQTYKHKINQSLAQDNVEKDSKDRLEKTPLEQDSQASVETTTEPNQPQQKRRSKYALQRQKGLTLDFVLVNGALKHIYHQQIASFAQKPFQISTWQTFSPNPSRLANAVLPSTLSHLTQTIHDEPQGNVIDGVQEFERIKKLDTSRRGLGQPATVFSQYDKYRKAAKAKALEENSATTNDSNNKPN